MSLTLRSQLECLWQDALANDAGGRAEKTEIGVHERIIQDGLIEPAREAGRREILKLVAALPTPIYFRWFPTDEPGIALYTCDWCGVEIREENRRGVAEPEKVAHPANDCLRARALAAVLESPRPES